jgi:hypothetical protein
MQKAKRVMSSARLDVEEGRVGDEMDAPRTTGVAMRQTDSAVKHISVE